MNILESLAKLKTIEVFCNEFTKISNGNLDISRNLVSKSVTISNGNNTIGKFSQYDQEYSLACISANMSNTNIYKGNVYYETSLVTSEYTNIDFSDIRKSNVFDYDSFYSELIGYSQYLRTYAQNGTKRYQSNTYSFSGTNSINFITLNSAEINNLSLSNTLKLNFPSESIVIFNILGNDPVYFNNLIFEFVNNKINESNVIFNFENNNVSIVGDLYGNILCNSATTTLNGANIYGSVYSNKIVSSASSKIYDSVIFDVDILPVAILNDTNIQKEETANGVVVSITVEDGSSVLYSLNGATFIEYSGSLIINEIGSHVVSAYSTKHGYINSSIISTDFIIKCTCNSPVISFNKNTNTLSFSTNIQSAKIYFTIDATNPTEQSQYVLNGGEYRIKYEGLYEVNAIAIDDVCESSSVSYEIVIVEYPEDTVFIDILGDEYQGMYPDDNGNGVRVQITSTSPTAEILYTIDGTSPMTNGIPYSGVFYTKSGDVQAVTKKEYSGYSNIVRKTFTIYGSFYIERNSSKEISDAKLDNISNIPKYGEDIGWLGPIVIVDDTSVYQALVNILSTPMMDIPFNPLFGVSIQHSIFELGDMIDSNTIISKLKSEIEYNDPRILIIKEESYAYFIESSSSLVIELEWVNRYTGEKAHVKYGYNLDGML